MNKNKKALEEWVYIAGGACQPDAPQHEACWAEVSAWASEEDTE